MSNNKDGAVILGGLLLIVFLLTIGSFITIMAINTLFSLAIPFNFFTWLSMSWIIWVFSR